MVRSKDFLQNLASFIQKEEMPTPNPNNTLVVGLSGGIDSVVLLHSLVYLGYPCIAAHCNFHLRTEESNRDAFFAKKYAASLKVPFVSIDFDTMAHVKAEGISIEMAARDLRYKWFEEIRQEYSAKAIAIAHHREDSAETFVLNLSRGTGIRGLTGIKPINGHIIRPLLCMSKKEIINYAHDNALEYVSDSTNLQDIYTRNKIRLHIMPLLSEINPSVQDAIYRTMDNLQKVQIVYDFAISQAKKNVFDEQKDTISIKKLRSFISPETLLYEILQNYGFAGNQLKEIYASLDGYSGKLFYSKTHRLVKDRDFLLLTKIDTQNNAESYWIPAEGSKLLTGARFKIDFVDNTPELEIEKNKALAYFDADSLNFPLHLRRWKQGDKFRPFGMKGFQKLSDYFNNNKFSKLDKEKIWILASGEAIIWLVGHRTDDRFRVNTSTKKLCIISFSE